MKIYYDGKTYDVFVGIVIFAQLMGIAVLTGAFVGGLILFIKMVSK